MKNLKLTENLLDVFGACNDGREFVKINNLIGMDIERLTNTNGDHDDFLFWLRDKIDSIKSVDQNGLILATGCDGVTYNTYTYDEQGRIHTIAYINNNLITRTYDEQGRIVLEKHTRPSGSSGDRFITYEYDGFLTIIKTSTHKDTVHNINYRFKNRTICDVLNGYMYIGSSMGGYKSHLHELKIDTNGDRCVATYGSICVTLEINDLLMDEICYTNGNVDNSTTITMQRDERGNVIDELVEVRGSKIKHTKNVFNYDAVVDVKSTMTVYRSDKPIRTVTTDLLVV